MLYILPLLENIHSILLISLMFQSGNNKGKITKTLVFHQYSTLFKGNRVIKSVDLNKIICLPLLHYLWLFFTVNVSLQGYQTLGNEPISNS